MPGYGMPDPVPPYAGAGKLLADQRNLPRPIDCLPIQIAISDLPDINTNGLRYVMKSSVPSIGYRMALIDFESFSVEKLHLKIRKGYK